MTLFQFAVHKMPVFLQYLTRDRPVLSPKGSSRIEFLTTVWSWVWCVEGL